MSTMPMEPSTEPVAYHAQLAADWEQRYRKRSFRVRQTILAECLNGFDLTGAQWLDAGCGTGTLSRWLAQRGCSVRGVDAAAEMLAAAAEWAKAQNYADRLSFSRVDTIAQLALDSSSMDGVLCSSVLEYVPDPGACVTEFMRVLKPRGLLLVSVPSQHSIVRKMQLAERRFGAQVGRNWAKFIEYSRHEYTVSEFTKVLETRGFQVERVLAFGSPLPRWIQRLRFGGSLLMFMARKKK